MLKSIARYPRVQAAIGAILAGYLKLVRATTRFEWLQPGIVDVLKDECPFICAIWHGQNFMIPLAMWDGAKVAVLITRHGDGAVVAEACERMGMTPIRASGGTQRNIFAGPRYDSISRNLRLQAPCGGSSRRRHTDHGAGLSRKTRSMECGCTALRSD